MPSAMSPGQAQVWEAVLAASGQPDLPRFQHALRAARPVLSSPLALEPAQRAELWARVVAHPDGAWSRATLKAYPKAVRREMVLATPLAVWERPGWLKAVWSLWDPGEVLAVLRQAEATNRLPAMEPLLRTPGQEGEARRSLQAWATQGLMEAIRSKNVEKMKHVWSWAQPTDEHWRQWAFYADAPMMAWLTEVTARQKMPLAVVKTLAFTACHWKGESAVRVFNWCSSRLCARRHDPSYETLFNTWVGVAADASNAPMLDALARFLPSVLSVRAVTNLAHRRQGDRLRDWLFGRAPPASQVFTQLTASHPPQWSTLDTIGAAWPNPEELKDWVQDHGAELPRSLARWRTVTSVVSSTGRLRPRLRV